MDTFISGLVGSIVTLVGSLLLFRTNNKSNELKHITSERKEWRDLIRKLVPEFLYGVYDKSKESCVIHETNQRKIITDISIRLNPFDPNDEEILNLMREYVAESNQDKALKIENAFARLLKHDWERVKKESKMTSIVSMKNIFLLAVYGLMLLCLVFPMKAEKSNFQLDEQTLIPLATKILFLTIFFILMFFNISASSKVFKYGEETNGNFSTWKHKIFGFNYRKK